MNKQLRKALILSLIIGGLSATNSLMAKSYNSLTSDLFIKEQGYEFNLSNAPELKIDLKDRIEYKGTPLTVKVKLENAVWLDSIENVKMANYFIGANFKKVNESTLEVRINNSIDVGIKSIPLLVKLTGGEASVKLEGGSTEVSDMDFKSFVTTVNKKAEVSVGNVPTIREEDKVAPIKIEELIKGSLASSDRADDRTITLTLLNEDYEFENCKPVVMGTKGLSNFEGNTDKEDKDDRYALNTTKQNVSTNYATINGKENKKIIKINLPQQEDSTAVGRLNITDLKVTSKHFKEGKIDLKVSGSMIEDKIVTVALTEDYGFTINETTGDKVEISNGDKKNISFIIEEKVLESMVEGRTIEVLFDKGRLATCKDAVSADLSIGSIKLNDRDISKQIGFTPIHKDGYAVGFSFTVPNVDKEKRNDIEFKDVMVYVPTEETGDINLKVSSKGVENSAEAKVATIKIPTSIEVEPFALQVGRKDQVGGKVVITETDRGMIKDGILELEIEKEEGMSFNKVPVVTVLEGDIKIGSVKYDGVKPNKLKIEIKRESNRPSTIEIKNFVVTTSAMVPDGGYKLSIKGTALTPDEIGAIEYPAFITIGQNVTKEEPTHPSFVKKQDYTLNVDFTIDSEVYKVNGIYKLMNTKPYIENNKTMVPLSYVAEALGIKAKDMTFDKDKVITIKTVDKIIELKIGSNIIEVNGVQDRISARPTIKDGRTYIPVAEIAELFDLQVSWNEATKTATFKK